MGEVGQAIGYALEDFALVVDPCRHAVGDMVTEKVYDPRLPPRIVSTKLLIAVCLPVCSIDGRQGLVKRHVTGVTCEAVLPLSCSADARPPGLGSGEFCE